MSRGGLAAPRSCAQTNYYWIGGTGSWDFSSNLWSLSSGGGSPGQWVDGTNSIASIGYVGTGGSYAAPATINLTTPITALSLVFGVAGGSTTTNNHYYALTGSGITIGDGVNPGLVSIDVGNYQSSGDSFIYNNLTVAGGQGLELGVTADPANPNLTGTITSYHYLKGTNTFSSLTIDNAVGAGANSRNWAYFNGAPSFTSGVNLTMGIGAGIIDTAASGTMTIGTINMRRSSLFLHPPWLCGSRQSGDPDRPRQWQWHLPNHRRQRPDPGVRRRRRPE